MRSLHVGVAQVQARAGDVAGNLQRMLRQVQAAAAVGVEALLFAETVVQAYNLAPENLALAEPLDGPLARQLSAWAVHYHLTLLAGMFERAEDGLYNTHVVATPAGRLAGQRKHRLTEWEIAAGLRPGPLERTLIELNGVRCALLICYETGIDGIHATLIDDGVEFLFIPTAGGGTPDEFLHIEELDTPAGRARYIANRSRVFNPEAILTPAGCPFPGWASANALGADGLGTVNQGHCMIVDRHRVLRAQIPGTNVYEHMLDQMAHAVVMFD